MRSPFAPVVLSLAALIAALVRWWMQGSGNLYTAIDKRFYVADPDLGWRISDVHPIWLGLEVCAIIAAIAAGLAVGGWIIRRREERHLPAGRRATILRAASWAIAVVPLVVPVAAFMSGAGVDGGHDTLPTQTAGSAPISDGITGSLDLPAGRYEVVTHAGTSITAKVSAGGEAFDARLGGDVRGTWLGDPRDLRAPSTADVSVAAASVDTGIRQRSASARDDYLQAAKYPRITFKLDRVVSARPTAPDQIAFTAKGTLDFVGKQHVVDVIGTLKKPDVAALARLGLAGAILLVQGDFSLVIKETAFAPDAGDFDGDRIPIHVSLVLRHTNG
ncbi:MAG: YceI family protein [Deltaproteobacteria bacterium]|nr:YceI family protein [Deltaproteobacteria bacterium]MDQ3298519.1 YceI family protein [Myxococcota bacterium]